MVRMATVHVSEAEAARDFCGLIARVHAGEEVVIDSASNPSVAMRVANEPTVLPISEVLRRMRERGSHARLDDEFARDLDAAIVAGQQPFPSVWD